MTGHIAAFLRYLADRIDHGGAPKYTHWSFTFETRRGLVFRDDGKGCPGAYLGDAAYERAHSEADSAASERDAGVNQKSRNPVMGASKQKPPVHMYIQCAGSVSINRQPVGHLDPAAYDILATYVPLDLPGFEHGDSLMFELRLVQVQNTPIAGGEEVNENGGDEEPGLSFLAENCAAYGTPGLQPVSQRGAPDQDHALIGRAREIGTALRASNSDRDRLAGWLLKELADLAERRQSSVMVLGSQLDRAAKLAQAITAAPLATTSGDDAWTVQDVLNVALGRGMDQLEKLYDAGHAPEVGWRPGGAR